MKNKKIKIYILSIFTIITLWVTYAYDSVIDSLNYLRWAWDTGHIGYIITEIFNSWWTNSWKIKSQYLELPDSLTFVNSTWSTSITQAPTANILKLVWDNLNWNKADKTTSISTNWPLSWWWDLSNNITLSISQANSTRDWYLSNTDWNTFNNKLSIESDPKIWSLSLNYTPKWNGTSLENSQIYDNWTNIGVWTSSPWAKLDVIGNTKTNQIYFPWTIWDKISLYDTRFNENNMYWLCVQTKQVM